MSIQVNLGVYMLNTFLLYDIIFSLVHRSKKKLFTLFCISTFLIGLHIGGYLFAKEENNFELFKIHRKASDAEVKRSYKLMLRIYHPDKNADDPNAQDKFIKVKRINEELTKKKNREIYDKYGAQDIREEAEEMEFIAFSLSKGFLIYFIALIFGIISTYKSKARILCFLAPIAFGVLEILYSQFEFEDIFDQIIPSLAGFDRVNLLRLLIGPLTCIIRLCFNVFDKSYDDSIIRHLKTASSYQDQLLKMNHRPPKEILSPIINDFSEISKTVQNFFMKSQSAETKNVKKIGKWKNIFYWVLFLSLQSSIANTIVDFVIYKYFE